MAIVTFAPGGITADTISEISPVTVTTPITAGGAGGITVVGHTRPTHTSAPFVAPPAVVNTEVALVAPTFEGPPNLGPISNLIVEGPTQRGENNFPSNGISLTRQMPPEANPYRLLPENYIMEQSGPEAPVLQRGTPPFYNYERPLDLLRYKSDRYWNVLSYAGGYSLSQNEINIIPFASINYLTVNNSSDRWSLRQGSIVDGIAHVTQGQLTMDNTNFLGVFIKEIILLEANYNVFSASAPTAQTLGGAAAPTTATNFGERIRSELDRGGDFGGGGFGGGGYP